MQRLKPHLKAVIFDMDGTIIKSESKWLNATKKYLQTFNLSVSQEAQDLVLNGLEGSGLVFTATKVKTGLNLKPSIREIIEQVKKLALEDFATGVDFIDGFQNFQKQLSNHQIKHSIATNADATSFMQLTNKLGFREMFGPHLYSIDHIGGIAKPDPAIFLHAAKQLEIEPKDCIVFEDSIFGFQAAKAAGMSCIAIKNDKNKNLLSMVHGSIDHYDQAIEELCKVLKVI